MTQALSARTNAWLWTAAFLIGTFGIGGLKLAGIIGGWSAMALFLASFLLLVPMMRAVERAKTECGMTSDAMRRYNRRVLVSAFGYIALFFIGMTIARHFNPPLAIRIILALAAALPVIGMIRAMALLLTEEQDEYLRSRLIAQSLIATGFLLTIATLYGFLNAFDVAPRVDAWAAFPLWAIGLAVGRVFQRDAAC